VGGHEEKRKGAFGKKKMLSLSAERKEATSHFVRARFS